LLAANPLDSNFQNEISFVLLDDDALLKAKQFTVFIFITDHEQAQ
jgi:hypothetical protein